jgi:hypothetical protein
MASPHRFAHPLALGVHAHLGRLPAAASLPRPPLQFPPAIPKSPPPQSSLATFIPLLGGIPSACRAKRCTVHCEGQMLASRWNKNTHNSHVRSGLLLGLAPRRQKSASDPCAPSQGAGSARREIGFDFGRTFHPQHPVNEDFRDTGSAATCKPPHLSATANTPSVGDCARLIGLGKPATPSAQRRRNAKYNAWIASRDWGEPFWRPAGCHGAGHGHRDCKETGS